MNDFNNEFSKISYLEINNCQLVFSDIPFNLFKNTKEENLDKLKIILKILYLFKDKINDKLIIDFIFEQNKENKLPEEVSFYQYILISLYTFINIYYTNNQFILIRFPQLFPKKEYEINFNYSLNIKLSNKEIIKNKNKYIFNSQKSDLKIIFEKITSQINEKFLLKDYKLFQYNFTCLAGTFDRCHLGHHFLIQTSFLLSKSHCFIGVCSDEMINHKGPFSILQTNYVRRKKIEEILQINGYNNKNCIYEIKTIYDSVDMAGIQQDLECLIVTSETYKGGLYCNEIRKKNKIRPVELCTINVIKINLDDTNKISSSILRKEILDKIPIEKINEIYFCFKNICNNLKCDNEDLVDYWWNKILNYYTKKWKFYHNLNHIYSFIDLYNKYNNLIENGKNEFLLSIFFHDIIYIPSRNDNEKESINKFNEFYQDIKPKNLNKEKVIKLITETENHLLNKEYNNDINLFLDMDMHIISKDNWEDYENKIRNEYCFVDYNIYKIKRKEFLEGLEKKEKIFRTNTFFVEFETKARKNIKAIINKLNNY